jgi:hypothetical protein
MQFFCEKTALSLKRNCCFPMKKTLFSQKRTAISLNIIGDSPDKIRCFARGNWCYVFPPKNT